MYLLITGHEEMKRLNKTVEQTEYLLLELKEQLQHHHEDSLSLSCHSMQSTDVKTASSQGLHASMDQTGQLPFATRTYNRDSLLNEQVSATQGMAKDQMAALAAELEAELELMELNINAEDILLDQSLIHDAGEVSSKGLQNSYYSDTSSHGMVEAYSIERPSAHMEASQLEYGVSAIELDHRLREVLEAQQQERILELEQLLKETEAKLLAKEHEILGWKNHVKSLTNLFQHASACGTHMGRCNNAYDANGTETVALCDNFVAAVPEVTKNTLELFHSFQDPPISTHVNYGESVSSLDLLANVSKQETNPRSSSGHVFSNEGNSFRKASYSSIPSLEGSLVTESNCCWDRRQGTDIDTPDFVVMEELNAHTAAQKSESLRGQAVSKALEISDYNTLDKWSDEIHSSNYGLNGHSDSLLVDVDGASSGIEILPCSLHHMPCKLDVNGTSLSLSDFGCTKELERDSSDVKQIGNSKPALDSCSVKEGMQVSKKGLKLKNEGSKKSTFKEGSVEVKSPVLDKIRHYEALVGRARGR